jgi:predicted ATPase
MDHDRFVVISGCSGGGKSTLLAELARRGHAIVEEPGRRIVIEELRNNGTALPWADMAAFARRAIAMALADIASAIARPGWVFFDRGLIDAAVALEHVTGEPVRNSVGNMRDYNRLVFMTPPWPEIYAKDAERRHGQEDAVAEYLRLLRAFALLGYETILLQKVGVAERADFVLRSLDRQGSH